MSNLEKESVRNDATLTSVDMKLEVIVIPVSDAARAEQFYRKLGWRKDVTPTRNGKSKGRF